jgi:hypothetical protein
LGAPSPTESAFNLYMVAALPAIRKRQPWLTEEGRLAAAFKQWEALSEDKRAAYEAIAERDRICGLKVRLYEQPSLGPRP